jgi:hypothetical protein
MQRRYPMLVANALANLPRDWKVQLVVKNSPGAQRGARTLGRLLSRNPERVTVTEMPDDVGRLRRVQVTSTPWFWKSLVADRVLLLSAGAALCGASTKTIDEFGRYSLVGALWSQRQQDRPGDTRRGMLVDRKVALAALQARGTPLHGPPEGDGSWIHEEMRRLVPAEQQAPRSVQAQFAISDEGLLDADSIPFMVAGTMSHIPGNRSHLVEHCPEIKMIYPALHDPNCFGAKSALNKEKCYASLCVTNPPGPGC